MFETKKNINDLTTRKLTENFGKSLLSAEFSYDMMVYTVNKDAIIDILKFLRDDEALQYNFLTTLCGIHYPDAKEQIGVIYHLHSFTNNVRIRVKTYTTTSHPVFPTATVLWPTANWMEREAYDFFGIIFEGHPNLKRILNMDEMDYFPLRKEYPLEDATREDKEDKFFGR